MNKTALIVVDIQNDYFPGGAFVLSEPEKTVKKITKLLNQYRSQGLPIAHIQHENLNPDLPLMLPGTEGQNIHPDVQPRQGERLFIKHYPNAFWQTDLENFLKEQNVKRVVVVGMMTHMCVSSTARAAMERGFAVTVIEDACTTRALELNGVEIPADTVQTTALAELTLIAQVNNLEGFIAGNPA